MKTTALLALPLLFAARTQAQEPPAMFVGRPAFVEGIDLGYYIWRDTEKPDTWHLRWTTKGVMRHFTGAVSAEGGELKSLKRIDVEEERQVLYPGRRGRVVVGPRGRAHVRPGRAAVVVTREQDHIEKDGDSRIVFATRTDDDIDGFDFKVDDKVTGLRFVLDIDGQPHPNAVEVGQNNRKLERLPLVVRLH